MRICLFSQQPAQHLGFQPHLSDLAAEGSARLGRRCSLPTSEAQPLVLSQLSPLAERS